MKRLNFCEKSTLQYIEEYSLEEKKEVKKLLSIMRENTDWTNKAIELKQKAD